MGLVSVVIPVFNGAKHVGEAIDSVLRQTYSPIEVIVIDDGSTDNSPDTLANYANRITAIRQSNQGVSAARNVGISKCTGEFVAFLDQDDYWRENKIARQIQEFQGKPSIGLVHAKTEYLNQQTGSLYSKQLWPEPLQLTGSCFDLLLLGNSIVNSSVVVRTSLLREIGGLDPQIRGNTCQDYDLWLRAAKVCEFGYVDEALTVFRVHPGQGQSNRRAMLQQELQVLFQRVSPAQWRKTTPGRNRIGAIYDELATIHFDAGDARGARKYFSKALSLNPSHRQALRFAVSCLPHPVARFCRTVAQSYLPRTAAAGGGRN